MPNPFEAAADQANYRVAEVKLVRCTRHDSAAVLCSNSGKFGRNGRSAAVGATLFWLTCPYLNAMVARLERQGAIGELQKLVRNNALVCAQHVASHALYERRARALLSAERWAFFEAHFISVMETSGSRKYGNAAVGHATDLKCLHALIAQSLCGANNVLGDAVMQYILHLSKKAESLREKLSSAKYAHTNGDDDKPAGADDVTFAAEKSSLDDVSALVAFVERWVVENVSNGEVTFPVLNADDLCSAACSVLTFLEGRPPRQRKKRRIN